METVLSLCGKRPKYSLAYRHPGGHRTSNMLDRQMRGMNRYFDHGQHLLRLDGRLPLTTPPKSVTVRNYKLFTDRVLF